MDQFEFHIFNGDNGLSSEMLIEHRSSRDSAKDRARALARKHQCAVDVAIVEGGDWNDRYIGTAEPRISGYGVSFGRKE